MPKGKGREGQTMRIIVIAIGSLLVLSGCSTNEEWGTLLGGGASALAGSTVGRGRGQLAAVAGGTLVGAAIGSNVGANMDRQGQIYSHPIPPPGYAQSRGTYGVSPGLQFNSNFNWRGPSKHIKGFSDGIDNLIGGGIVSIFGRDNCWADTNTSENQTREVRDDYYGVMIRTRDYVSSNTRVECGTRPQHNGWDW